MRSHTTGSFRRAFRQLPLDIQQRARNAYRRFLADPHHPGLQFKRIRTISDVYSVRISMHYRAVAVRRGDTLIWFWIGGHDEYERLLSQLS